MSHSDQTFLTGLATGLRRELTPRQFVPNVVAGIIVSAIELPLVLALAMLIFSGDLADYASRGVGFMLMSSVVAAAIIAVGSSVRAIIAAPQDGPATIMVVIAAALAATMAEATSSETIFLTVIAAMMITAVGTGLIFFLIGWFNQGNLVRFIPFPVIGGFLAGTGLLLLEWGIAFMADVTVNLTEWAAFTDLNLLVKWLPGLLFAILLTVLLRHYDHMLLVPGVLLAAFVIFYGALLISGTSMDGAIEGGWLLEKLNTRAGGLWQPLSLADWQAVDWAALGGQMGNFAAIIIVSVISLLLNATGLELATERDIDLNRELKVAGVSNILVGLGGGLTGFHLLGSSVLAYRIGNRSRLPGLITAGMALLILFVGGDLIAYFPKAILGGLILFLALDFLIAWLYDTWTQLPKIDFAIIVLIMLVIERIGFLEGIGLGMLVAVGSFVINYSRIEVVKYALTGQTYRSTVQRSPVQEKLLETYGDELYILKLHGFIFFGTATHLLDQVRACLADPACSTRRCIVMDFHAVTGVDSSALLSFAKMRQVAQQHSVTLIFTALASAIREQLTPDVIQGDDDPVCKVFVSLDHGMEWAENALLAHYDPSASTALSDDLADQLTTTLMDDQLAFQLLKYLTHDEVAAGTYLVRQGDPPNHLIFVRNGSITIQLERDHAPPVRLRIMTRSTFVGEIGMYLSQPATASVIANTRTTISRLTVDGLQRMEHEEPEVASAFHRFMARSLAERVKQTTNVLHALAD